MDAKELAKELARLFPEFGTEEEVVEYLEKLCAKPHIDLTEQGRVHFSTFGHPGKLCQDDVVNVSISAGLAFKEAGLLGWLFLRRHHWDEFKAAGDKAFEALDKCRQD